MQNELGAGRDVPRLGVSHEMAPGTGRSSSCRFRREPQLPHRHRFIMGDDTYGAAEAVQSRGKELRNQRS